jgi:hypothetical protein
MTTRMVVAVIAPTEQRRLTCPGAHLYSSAHVYTALGRQKIHTEMNKTMEMDKKHTPS